MTVSVSNCTHFLDSLIGCIDGVSSHGLRRFETVSASSPRCSPDTQSPFSGRVFREQRGGAAEILPRIGVEHENQPQLRILLGGIRTYLNLLELVDIV